MKKLATYLIAAVGLIGTPTFAADMAVKAPPPPPAPVYSWTGFYVGLNAGYGWGEPSYNFDGDNGAGREWLFLLNSTSGSFDTSGFVGGGQIGYNWQINQTWVAGLETDINYADVHGSNSITTVAASTLNK